MRLRELVIVQLQWFRCDVIGCKRTPAMPSPMSLLANEVPVIPGKREGSNRWPDHPFIVCDFHAKEHKLFVLIWEPVCDLLQEVERG